MKKFILGIAIIMTLAVLLIGCADTKQKEAANEKIPKIPHKVTDNIDCKSCHKTGQNGAKVAKHIDRPNCTSCHQVAAASEADDD